ncbi:hypothetical protein PBI_SMEAGOL_81 [Mycobacterium phage Smeagol]|nr:hypothetical protein PBI_SMEAGOL_81 [Mycobacterium phage Smeagol]
MTTPDQVSPPREDGATPPGELRLTDRCDACSAAAMERWENGRSEFLFCKHHARSHKKGLTASGWLATEVWRYEMTTREVEVTGETKTSAFATPTKTKETEYIRLMARVREL